MSKKIIAITVVIIKIHNHTRTRVYLKKITKHVSHQCFLGGVNCWFWRLMFGDRPL